MYHPTSKKTITKTNRPKINENNGLIWASCQSRGKYIFREHAELYLCIKNRKVGGKYNLTKSSLIALATAFLVDAVLFGIFCSSASTIVRSYSIKGCHWSNTQKAPNIQWKKYKRTVLFLGTMQSSCFFITYNHASTIFTSNHIFIVGIKAENETGHPFQEKPKSTGL